MSDALDLRPGLVQTLSWRDAFLVLPICPITLSTASAATKQLFGGEFRQILERISGGLN